MGLCRSCIVHGIHRKGLQGYATMKIKGRFWCYQHYREAKA